MMSMFPVHQFAMRSVRLVAAMCVIAVCNAASLADTLHVPIDYATIQAAIDAAVDGDEVVVAPGTYHEAINFLRKAITVRSSGGREVTTIDASTLAQPVSVVTFASGETRDAVLEEFTITGGQGTVANNILYGGGAFISGSSPTVRNCRFSQNEGQYGGGLAAVSSASPLIDDCVFVNNESSASFTGGGGAMITSGSTAVIANCTFDSNNANYGGGLLTSANAEAGGVVVDNCLFINNIAHGTAVLPSGGAVSVNTGGLAEFIACTFQQNSVVGNNGIGAVQIYGGPPGTPASATFDNCAFSSNPTVAIQCSGSATIHNCTFEENVGGISAGHNVMNIANSTFDKNIGAGAIRSGGFVTITGCTFLENTTSDSQGGGAIRYGFSVAGANLNLSDCLFAANSAATGGAISADGVANIVDCTFEENQASSGGAIRIWNGSIQDTHIRNNAATSETGGGGGVVKIGGGTVTIANTLIDGNSAVVGGAIQHQAGTLTVTNSTISGNSADSGAGAAKSGTFGELLFQSTVFCENDPDHIEGPWTDLGGNEFLDECPLPIPGDLDGDGSVGVQDLLLLLGAWGSCDDCTPGKSMCFGDLDGDCTVGVADLLMLLANWG